MFTTIIVQPIFNLLVLICALLPRHNFGVAIIVFTILIRMLMWPLVKKQINQTKAMRQLQPELKKIKVAAKGDKQKESAMTMELYKERGVNPFSSILILVVQLPILIGLYSSVRRIVDDPHQIVVLSYPALHHLSWVHSLTVNINNFDNTLFGVIDLGRKAIGPHGIYWPALVIVAASAVAQFFQSKQLMPQSEDSRGLRAILREAGSGKTADQSEVNAAVGRGTMYLIPGFVFIFGLGFPAALPLYWLTSSLVAYWQQSRILREDVAEADASVDNLPAETKGLKAPNKKSNKKNSGKKSRRKKK